MIPSALGYLAAPLLTVPVEKDISVAVCKEGGMTPEGLLDGVKAPPGLSAFSYWVSCLTWLVRLNTDQAFIPASPAASASNKATI